MYPIDFQSGRKDTQFIRELYAPEGFIVIATRQVGSETGNGFFVGVRPPFRDGSVGSESNPDRG